MTEMQKAGESTHPDAQYWLAMRETARQNDDRAAYEDANAKLAEMGYE